MDGKQLKFESNFFQTYNSLANRKFLVAKMASFSVAALLRCCCCCCCCSTLALPTAMDILSDGAAPVVAWSFGLTGAWFLRRCCLTFFIVAGNVQCAMCNLQFAMGNGNVQCVDDEEESGLGNLRVLPCNGGRWVQTPKDTIILDELNTIRIGNWISFFGNRLIHFIGLPNIPSDLWYLKSRKNLTVLRDICGNDSCRFFNSIDSA